MGRRHVPDAADLCFPSINGLNAHGPHQPSDPSASDPEEILSRQEIAQHPSARKGILQMQSIELSRNREICLRGPLRAVIHRLLGDTQYLCLSAHRQLMARENHFLALSNPALESAVSKKSFSKVRSMLPLAVSC
jgi:hypothetical protein